MDGKSIRYFYQTYFKLPSAPAYGVFVFLLLRWIILERYICLQLIKVSHSKAVLNHSINVMADIQMNLLYVTRCWSTWSAMSSNAMTFTRSLHNSILTGQRAEHVYHYSRTLGVIDDFEWSLHIFVIRSLSFIPTRIQSSIVIVPPLLQCHSRHKLWITTSLISLSGI